MRAATLRSYAVPAAKLSRTESWSTPGRFWESLALPVMATTSNSMPTIAFNCLATYGAHAPSRGPSRFELIGDETHLAF